MAKYHIHTMNDEPVETLARGVIEAMNGGWCLRESTHGWALWHPDEANLYMVNFEVFQYLLEHGLIEWKPEQTH